MTGPDFAADDADPSSFVDGGKVEPFSSKTGISLVLRDEKIALRGLLADYEEAARTGDLQLLDRLFSREVVAFDIPPPFQLNGFEEYRRSWEKWYTTAFEFPVLFHFQNPRFFIDGDLAFIFMTAHLLGEFKETAKTTECWIRQTCCLKKTNGDWKIVHEHLSAPVGADGRSMMEIPPDQQH